MDKLQPAYGPEAQEDGRVMAPPACWRKDL
jgi:hypothetical protein